MSIASKIAMIAENVPKVYEAGMAEYNRRAWNNELDEVVIPEDVTTMSGRVTVPSAKVLRLESANLSAGAIDPRNYGKDDGFAIVIGKNVKSIPASFCSTSGLYSDVISNLKSIVFEDGCVCENIGSKAFYIHPLLSGELFVKGNNMTVNYSAFHGHSGAIDKIKLKGVAVLDDRSFQEHQSLKKIIFVDKPTTIHPEAFIYCGDTNILTNIYVPWSADDELSKDAPWGVSNSIVHYDYPTNIEFSVEVPEGSDNAYMTVEGEGAIPDFASRAAQIWRSDNYVIHVTIKDGITEIGDRAFAGFPNANDVILPSSLKVIGVLAFDSFGSDLTNGYYNLRKVTLPEGLEVIQKRAFQKTGLQALTIPSTVKKIEEGIVEYCTNLKTVTFKGKPDTIHAKAFALCESITDIYVPWGEGEVANAPWGSTTAAIHYNSEV